MAKATYQPGLLDTVVTIVSDQQKAERVWKGLLGRIGKEARHEFSTVFFSESDEAYQQMFHYARYIFDHEGRRELDYGNPHVMAINGFARQVSRERHRMKAFVRFKKSASGLFFAVIAPDFNVLPLIVKHFADRYRDQHWLIFDKRRNYGIYYDLQSVEEVKISLAEGSTRGIVLPSEVLPDEKDPLYTSLWQDYFKSTNIKERANLKLHIQHVPKRYWKYLPEKFYGM